MGPEARSRFGDERAFARWFRIHAESLLADAATFREAPRELLVLSGGVELVLVDGEWRVERSPLDEPGRTPLEVLGRLRRHLADADALQLLSRALQARRRSVLARLDAFLAGEAPLPKAGDRMQLDLGQGADVTLVREGGGWRIDRLTTP
jgi:hypothetical protein